MVLRQWYVSRRLVVVEEVVVEVVGEVELEVVELLGVVEVQEVVLVELVEQVELEE